MDALPRNLIDSFRVYVIEKSQHFPKNWIGEVVKNGARPQNCCNELCVSFNPALLDLQPEIADESSRVAGHTLGTTVNRKGKTLFVT